MDGNPQQFDVKLRVICIDIFRNTSVCLSVCPSVCWMSVYLPWDEQAKKKSGHSSPPWWQLLLMEAMMITVLGWAKWWLKSAVPLCVPLLASRNRSSCCDASKEPKTQPTKPTNAHSGTVIIMASIIATLPRRAGTMFGCIMRLITRLYECLLVVVVFRNKKLQVGGGSRKWPTRGGHSATACSLQCRNRYRRDFSLVPN